MRLWDPEDASELVDVQILNKKTANVYKMAVKIQMTMPTTNTNFHSLPWESMIIQPLVSLQE